MNNEMISRFKGCLLGGAIGDALGAPVEFDTLQTIFKNTGGKGVTGFMPCYGGIGKITDDTQMSLFTGEALIRAYFAQGRTNKDWYLTANGTGLLRWYKTQDERYPMDRYSGLLAERRLFARRAPGATCMSAIRAMLSTTQFANNNSKGCGTVMRMAPVGLFAHSTAAIDSFSMGWNFSAQTHGHPTGYIAGGAFAYLIERLADGTNMLEAVLFTMGHIKDSNGHEETHAALNLAVNLFLAQEAPETAIKKLGQGWIAEEALGIAVYCALMAHDFRHGVLMAVNHDGDTDSTGSMTGNILGVVHGVEALPAEWLAELELADVIEQQAEDLAMCASWTQDSEGAQRYYVNY
ncbi:ADP-ribosylglycohydrolase family protein [Salmonella enterica]|nr:ADP-ribosylglycohydrolase family protein [Salmonella enterica]EJT3914077.1 ADP-ribosylglycohydrolase family protein [Salmonella enterica]ELL1510019.1 ADP-ribosylglycohydrolase family protein [Salmonella enterica]